MMSEQTNIHVTVVTEGLDHPWGLALVSDDDGVRWMKPTR